MEEMLISAVMPMMSIYRLPHGQYGYSGHVINLPQDVLSFASTLPRLPSQLDMIVVRKERTNQSHHDFRVRRSLVHCALQWLIANNMYYRANQVHIDQLALATLPDDGNLSNVFPVVIDNPTASDHDVPAAQDSEPNEAHLSTSFVPTATRSLTEEAVQQQVHNTRASCSCACV